jgi:hypothetical protein
MIIIFNVSLIKMQPLDHFHLAASQKSSESDLRPFKEDLCFAAFL